MHVDCDLCGAPPAACGDCVMSVFLGDDATLSQADRGALSALADQGLLPPLRLVPMAPPEIEGPAQRRGWRRPALGPGDAPGPIPDTLFADSEGVV